jgi:hypothetical protein
MPEGPGAYGLCISADNRLVLLRAADTEPLRVERGDRSLEAPEGKPVVLLDQDLLCTGGCRLRVHVHGETEAVYAPERLSRSAFLRLARAAAAAATLALGGVSAAASGPGAGSAVAAPAPIEVRTRPPIVAASRSVDCTITRQKASRKGPLTIHATCAAPQGLRVGISGSILDPKTRQTIKDGLVTVKRITGKAVVVEAPRLTKPVNATTIRFWVSP